MKPVLEKSLNTITNALNIANKAGCFYTLRDSTEIYMSLNNITEALNEKESEPEDETPPNRVNNKA